jgi:kynureninase
MTDLSRSRLKGALPSEVTLMGGLTGNLHVMMTSFYRPDVASGRTKIIFEANAFPSDLVSGSHRALASTALSVR